MRHQKGASYIAILFAVIGIAFIIKIAVAVWGPYLDDRLINNQIEEQLLNGQKNMTPAKFVQEMDRRLSMNNVSDVKFADIAIRKPFLLNIDIVLKFEKRFDQSSVQAK